MPGDWTEVAWKASASYKSSKGDQNGNRHRERIWFSPGCAANPLLMAWSVAELAEHADELVGD